MPRDNLRLDPDDWNPLDELPDLNFESADDPRWPKWEQAVELRCWMGEAAVVIGGPVLRVESADNPP